MFTEEKHKTDEEERKVDNKRLNCDEQQHMPSEEEHPSDERQLLEYGFVPELVYVSLWRGFNRNNGA